MGFFALDDDFGLLAENIKKHIIIYIITLSW